MPFYVARSRSQVFGLLAVQQCMLQTRATVAVVTWLSAVVALWILCIFSGQLGLIAGETTTYQVLPPVRPPARDLSPVS